MVNGIQKRKLETCAAHPGDTSAFDISAQSNLRFRLFWAHPTNLRFGGDAVDFQRSTLTAITVTMTCTSR